MATNYKVIQNNSVYQVVEAQTGHVVFQHSQQSEAKKMMRHLNLGGSFDGWTPGFFLKSTSTPHPTEV